MKERIAGFLADKGFTAAESIDREALVAAFLD